MTAAFGLATVVYALAVAAVCALTALRGRPRSPLIVPALVVIELLTIVQAALDVAGLTTGPRPAEPATHVGYLIASVAILPVAAGTVRLDEDRWGTAGLGIGCLVVAVVSFRLHQTLAPAGYA